MEDSEKDVHGLLELYKKRNLLLSELLEDFKNIVHEMKKEALIEEWVTGAIVLAFLCFLVYRWLS